MGPLLCPRRCGKRPPQPSSSEIDKPQPRCREKGNWALRKRKIRRWHLTAVSRRWPTAGSPAQRAPGASAAVRGSPGWADPAASRPRPGLRPTPRRTELRAVARSRHSGRTAGTALRDSGAPGSRCPGSLPLGEAQGVAQNRGALQESHDLASVCPVPSPALPCVAGSDCLLRSC